MPVQLNVRAQTDARLDAHTFGNALKNQLASVDGKAKISELLTYLDGKKDNALIRVVNTTRNKDLALRVKSWGHDKAYRQQRTAETLKQLLSRAGVPADVASRVVDDVLKPGGNHRIATAGLIKAILNDAEVIFALAAPPPPVAEFQPPLQAATGHIDAGPVNPLEKIREEFKNPNILDTVQANIEGAPDAFEEQALKQPLAQENALLEPALIEPHVIEPDGATFALQGPAPLPSAQILAPKTPFTIVNNSGAPFDLAMDKFLTREGFNPGKVLGKGNYGVVKLAGVAPGDESFVAKYFTDGNNPKPVKLSLNRGVNQMNEAYAAYLVKTKDAGWQPPKVIAPTHYIVGRPNALHRNATDIELVPIAELKNTIRENAMWPMSQDLRCYGLVMAKAPGEEVEKQINDLSTNVGARAQMAKSGLESLRSLNQRGFIHRDIKPANLLFDGTDVSFIDTGMLFKVQKTAADQEAPSKTITKSQAEKQRASKLPVKVAGSPEYLHPNVLKKRAIGTQADLHAFGLVLLNAESPEVYDSFFSKVFINTNDWKTSPIRPQDIRKRIDRLIEKTKASKNPKHVSLNQSAKALKQNIDDPKHPAHLAMLCLTKASTTQRGLSAVNWANRKFSDIQYQELLAHPALDLVSRGASE